MKTLFTARAIAKGGRGGHTQTENGNVSFDLGTIEEVNAKKGITNPEELFACGYAACFGSAVEMIAKKKNVDTAEIIVKVEASLNQEDSGYVIGVVLDVSIPSLDNTAAQALVEAAHQMCPYSKATRGNINVVLKANAQSIAKAA